MSVLSINTKRIPSFILLIILLFYFSNKSFAQCNSGRCQDSLQLVTFYNALDGPNWSVAQRWDLTQPMDTWFGVTLIANGRVAELKNQVGSTLVTGMNGHLPSLNLPELRFFVIINQAGITGGIPSLNVPKLWFLHLDNNNLTGTIPNFSLPLIKTISFINNQLTGSIPNFNCPELDNLRLSNNQLTGAIPNFNLPKLDRLLLDNNQLTGGIPNFNLPLLISLDFNDNQLTGSIPNFNLPKLRFLYADHNQLTGVLPAFNLPKLELLYLHSNQLTGSIPNFNCPLLEILELQNNAFTGIVPNFNMPNLKTLTFTNNQLTGALPNFNMPHLEFLTIGQNELSTIPHLTQVAALKRFDVFANFVSFDDVIPNLSNGITLYQYDGQKKLGQQNTTVDLIEGDSYTIDLGFDANVANNIYKWYKDGVLFKTIVGYNTLTLNNVTVLNAGDYSCKITNPSAPLLELETYPVKINLPCIAPFYLGATNRTTNGATLGWSYIGYTTVWDVEIGLSGFQPTGVPTANNVINLPYVWTGGAADTAYDFYVRADCTASGTAIGQSDWAGPFTFQTACNALSIPYSEGFNSNSNYQDCWTVIDENTDNYTWDMDANSHPYEGDEYALIYTDFNNGNNNDWLISPKITMTQADQLRFRYRVQDASEPNDFELLLSTTGIEAADFTTTLIANTAYYNTTYMEKTVDLSAYSGDVYVAWHVPNGGLDGYRLFIDDVHFEKKPALGDNLCDAIPLTVNMICLGEAFNNINATLETAEPTGTCFYNGQNTVWFSFVAPASGDVVITTDLGIPGIGDSQIAVYAEGGAFNCADLSTLGGQVACIDDGGITHPYMSILNVNNLTAGDLYYIQLAGYNNASGSFCIEVEEAGLIIPLLDDNDNVANYPSSLISHSKVEQQQEWSGIVAENMRVYPVPSRGLVYLNFTTKEATEATIMINDLNGKVVYTRQLSTTKGEQQEQFNLSDLPVGVYILTLTMNGQRQVQRVVKN